MQLVNKITIRNIEYKSIVDEIKEDFVMHFISSSRDLYSAYDQFQLAKENSNLTTINIFLDLMYMWILSQGIIYLVTHMQNVIN